MRIDEFEGRKRRAAALALVAVSAGLMAVGAFSRDVAVSQESLGFFIVVLLTFLFDKFAFIVERLEELCGRLFREQRSSSDYKYRS